MEDPLRSFRAISSNNKGRNLQEYGVPTCLNRDSNEIEGRMFSLTNYRHRPPPLVLSLSKNLPISARNRFHSRPPLSLSISISLSLLDQAEISLLNPSPIRSPPPPPPPSLDLDLLSSPLLSPPRSSPAIPPRFGFRVFPFPPGWSRFRRGIVSDFAGGSMGQQSLIYSFVARGTVILAEYTEFTGNFTSIASQCLQKLPATNNKFTYNCDGHTFNYLVENGFTYCVVAAESAGRQIPIAFLERIKDDFNKRYGGGKATTAAANSLNREFGPKLKEHMQYCVDHPEEISKLAKVKAQVSEVKGVMMENIEKVLDRGEKIELLVDKTENLRSQAQDFKQQGTKIRRKMWLQNMKIKLIVLGIIVALILIIILSVCHGFKC
ncbi:hypothetical protein EUGRSUZ_H00084 [Eucalyptus grandis]|uniref:Uncharacterized protein n=3 Tax=Eucalyptus TaxID=3932 RepID=A0ACC3JM48_EUCGR|nr:hypothetical protein EUGRSUZ_H00084 [Eucalyptus grandis]